jgi:hypothetical protein
MRWWGGALFVSCLMSGVVHGAGASKLSPEQAANALIAFSIVQGKCNKALLDPNVPMDKPLSRYGYGAADFMPGGRHVKLMEAASTETAKSIATIGLTLTCLQAVNLVEQTFPGMYAVPPLWSTHFLWHIKGVDKLRTDKRFYRRFAQEGELVRNIFVLTCPKQDQQFELEVIPPVSELGHLTAFTRGREVDTSVAFANPNRSIVSAGRADTVAGWILFKEELLPGIVELISQKDLRVSLFEAGLEYRFSSDMAASEKINGIFTANRAKLESEGGMQTLSSADVIRDCRSFRSAK